MARAGTRIHFLEGKELHVVCWLVLTVNSAQSGITWEESLHGGIILIRWFYEYACGKQSWVSVGIGKPNSLWAAPFPLQRSHEQCRCWEIELSRSKQRSKTKCIFSLSAFNYRCGAWSSCLEFPPMIDTNLEFKPKQPLFILCCCRSGYVSQQQTSGIKNSRQEDVSLSLIYVTFYITYKYKQIDVTVYISQELVIFILYICMWSILNCHISGIVPALDIGSSLG